MSIDDFRVRLLEWKKVLTVDWKWTVSFPQRLQLLVYSRCVEPQPQKLGCWLLIVWRRYNEYSATSICVVYNMRVYSAVWRRQAESDQHTSQCVRPAQYETVRTSLLSTGQRRWVETTVLPSSCVFCVTDNFSGWVVRSVRCVFVSVFVCVSGQQLSIRVSFSVSFSEKVKKYRWLKWIYVILSNEMRVYHPFEVRFRSI